ncbi:MAG: phosphoribosylaminoimidazolesuccinocarboxamide synthase [Bacteroidales bacterium]|nr:phosphoribosylaminoimidazolesuccinocarboxamide synthase [Bacteroidales bacterium]
MDSIVKTNFDFKNLTGVYNGKVRDVYFIDEKYMVMVATDRISAFDVVLPRGIPYKGQVLNQIASQFLDRTTDIVKNWKIACPDPMVTIGYKCCPLPVEMIVRGYLTGSSWRTYKSGARQICGVDIPDGMREHQRFDSPIVTPTTKAEVGGHDQDISKEEIIAQQLVPADIYNQIEEISLKLFERGSQIAAERGLILVDTKYEFGLLNGEVCLMDEIHTPDSSRYFYKEGYQERFDNNQPQRQLSKEFVREWLMANGFQGRSGEVVPPMTDEVVNSISNRYIELYEAVTGNKFVKQPYDEGVYERIEENVKNMLQRL